MFGGRDHFYFNFSSLSLIDACRSAHGRMLSTSWPSIIKGFINSTGSSGLVMWPSSAADTGERRALFEPCKFARLRSRRTAQGTRMATAWPRWFWVLLPKQKACPEPCRRRPRVPDRYPASNSHLQNYTVRSILGRLHNRVCLDASCVFSVNLNTPLFWRKLK